MRHPITLFLLLGLAAGSAHAATYYVATTGNDLFNGSQASPLQHIQAGINRAASGDTVYVENGTYSGTSNTILNVQDKGIALRSLGGAANCIIDCAGAVRGIQFSGASSGSTLDGFTIRNANATGAVGTGQSGGGVVVGGCSPTISNCIITGNRVQSTGGNAVGAGIGIQNGSPSIVSCTITNNTAQAVNGTAAGAGVYVEGASAPRLSACTVSGNTVSCTGTAAGAAGGGLFSTNGTLNLSDCVISDNTASGDGNDCSGAGVYTSGAVFLRCTVSGNQITGTPIQALGGGIYGASGTPGTLSLTACTIQDNYLNDASQICRGAGLFLYAQATLLRCTIQGNVAHADSNDFEEGVYGGGLYSQGNLTLSACRFIGNHGTGNRSAHGGGLALGGAHATIENCSFLGNSVTPIGYARGGAAYLGAATATAVNCEFVFNAAYEGSNGFASGGAVNIDSGTNLTLTNCTMTANSAGAVNGQSAAGGGIDVAHSSATVANCVLYGDAGYDYPEIVLGSSASCTVSYSDIEGGVSGLATDAGHNINADPRFIRAPGTNDSSDYGDLHIQPGSPCVNAGTASAASLPAFDIDGCARNQGGAPDIGADEIGSAPAFDIYVDKAAGSDTTGTGTSTKPYQTVAKALSAIPDPLGFVAIHIKQGNYATDKPRVTAFVKFVNWTNTGRAAIGKQ